MTEVSSPRVGVVLVNWRGWQDTLLSLETLFGGEYLSFDAVVVDNASGDDSVDHILAWAEGPEQARIPDELQGRVRARTAASVLDHILLHEDDLGSAPLTRARLTIIRAADNRGFAAGNNLALAHLRRLGGYHYFWLLNNDAFPAPEALARLVERAVADPRAGQVGATLVYSRRPDVVQALGGAEYQPRSGRAYHIGEGLSLAELGGIDTSDVERRMTYVVGASILVSAPFVDQVGPMEEDYFLYFEEIDWAERGRPEFGLAYARDSIIYHKAGGSTQSASRRSLLAAYYLARNRLVFTRRFHPECLTTVTLGVAKEILSFAAFSRWAEARGYFRALRESVGLSPKGAPP